VILFILYLYLLVGAILAYIAAGFLAMASDAPGSGPWALLVGVPVIMIAWPLGVVALLLFWGWMSLKERMRR
jgi:hypothetical protein